MKRLAIVGLSLLLMAGCSEIEETATEPKEPKESEEVKPEPAAPDSTEYDAEVSEALGNLSLILTDFSLLLIEGSSDPLLMISDEYNQDLRNTCDLLYNEIQMVKTMDVPSDRADVHERLLGSLYHFEIVAIDTPAAVENLDAEKLAELTNEMTAGNEKLVTLTADLPELMAE